MKIIILLFGVTCMFLNMNAQVGINTTSPTSTFDIVAKAPTGNANTVDGLLIPRVDRQRAQSMNSIPVSTLIYINDITTGTATGSTVNVDATGYYYFNGTVWIKLNLNLNLYNSNGSLTGDRVVNGAGNYFSFINTAGFGIGTAVPDGLLDLVADDVGDNIANDMYLEGYGSSAGADLYIVGARGTRAAPTALLNGDQIGTYGFTPYIGSGLTMGHAAITSYVANNSADLRFGTGGEGNTRMRIDETGKVGIGTDAPQNLLHLNGTDPLRLEGLQPISGKEGTLVTNSNGVVQLETASSVSAVMVTGSASLAINNTTYDVDVTSPPTKAFDNLNEFNGATFTASSAGLYKVDYLIHFAQRAATNDGGDGYMGFARINRNSGTYSAASTKVNPTEAAGGVASYITCVNTAIVKLDAGNTLTFRLSVYGATNNVSSDYVINIFRIN